MLCSLTCLHFLPDRENPHCLEPGCLKCFSGGNCLFGLWFPTRSSVHPVLTWCSVSHPVTESSHPSALEMALIAILAACYGNTHLYRGALVTHLLIQLFFKAVASMQACVGERVLFCPVPAPMWWLSTQGLPVLKSAGNFTVKLLILECVGLTDGVCHPLHA